MPYRDAVLPNLINEDICYCGCGLSAHYVDKKTSAVCCRGKKLTCDCHRFRLAKEAEPVRVDDRWKRCFHAICSGKECQEPDINDHIEWHDLMNRLRALGEIFRYR